MKKLILKLTEKNNLIYFFTLIYIIFIICICNISYSNNYNKGYEILQNKNVISLQNETNFSPINYKKNQNSNFTVTKESIITNYNNKCIGFIDLNTKVKIINKYKDKQIITYANTKKISMSNTFCKINNLPINILNIGSIDKRNIKEIKLKKIYLTFDDGPTQMTKNVLEVLDKNNVKATFFFNGAKSKDEEKILKDIVNSGNLLALHTYSHDYKKIYKSPKSFINDLEKNRKTFKQITGYDCKIFRFPGGTNNTVSFSYGGKKVIKNIIKLSKKYGYDYVDWNAFPNDTNKKVTSKQYNIIIKQAKGNDETVVLIHVFDRNKNLPKGLDNVIKKLKKQGYTFDTVDNLSSEIKFTPAK